MLKTSRTKKRQGPVSPQISCGSPYRAIFASSDDALLMTDRRGKVIDASEKLEAITGYDRTELIGRSAFSLARLLTRNGPMTWLKNPLNNRPGEQSHEVDAYSKSGERATLEFKSRLIREDGVVVGRLVTVVAVNDCRSGVDAQPTSAGVHRSLVNHVGIGVFRSTPGITGRFLEVNPAMEEITGYSREELLQMNVADLYVHREERAEVVRQVLSGELTSPVESQFRKKDGTLIVVRDKEVAVTGENGRTIYLEGFLEDVTEKKQVEEALEGERENLRNSLEMSPLRILVVSLEGELVYVNRTMLDMWGYKSLEELKQVPTERRYTPESVAAIRERNELRRRGGEPPPHEVTIIRSDGLLRLLIAHNKQIVWNGKKCTEVVYEDITERKRAEEALSESERRLRNAQVAGRIGDWEYDVATRKISWSDEMYELFERNRALGPPSVDEDVAYHTPEEVVRIKRLAVQAINTGQSFRRDLDVRLPGGKVVFLSATLRPILDQKGHVVKLFGTVHDITDRKKTEQALVAERENFRNSVETSPFGIQIITLSAEQIFANRTMLDWWGYASFEEMKAVPIDRRFTPKSIVVIDEQNEERRHGNILSSYEVAMVCKDGSQRDLQAHAEGIDWNGEKCIQIQYEDITERKRAEAATQAERDSFRNAMEVSPVGIMITNLDGEVVYANPAVLDIWGYDTVEELKAVPLEKRFTPESAADVAERIEATKRGQVEWKHELTAISKGGRRRDFSVFRRPIVWDGESRVQVLYEDITELREAEAAVLEERENFRSSVEASPLGVQVFNLKGELVYANRTMLDMWGYSTIEQLRAVPIKQAFTPASATLVRQTFRENNTGGLSGPQELTMICADGRLRDVRAYTKEATWNNEKGVQTLYEDITERKRAENLYSTLADSSPVGVYIVQGGKFAFTNPAFKTATGFGDEELRDRQSLSLVAAAHREEVRKNAVEMLSGKSTQPYQFQYVTKSGETRWAVERVSSITYGEKRSTLGTFLDVTEIKRAEEALLESERKYRDLVDNAPVGIVVTSHDGRVLEVNRALAQMHGYDSKQEFIRLAAADRFRDLKERDQWVAIAEKNGRVEGYEIETKRKDGSTFWSSLSSIPRTTATGEKQLLTISLNITKRKEAEDRLRQSEKKYSTFVQQATDVIIIIQDGLVKFSNSRVTEITGFTVDEVVGHSFIDFVSPWYRAVVAEAYKNRISGEPAPNRYQIEIVAKDGRSVPVETAGSVIEYEGRPADMVLIRDITERKMAEDTLKQSEEKLRLMFQSVAEGIAVLDQSFVITDANKRLVELCGFASREEMIGRLARELVAPDDLTTVQRVVQRMAEFGVVDKFEFHVMKADGQTFLAEVNAGVLKDGSGNVVGEVVTVRDVTEARWMQQQLMAQDRLASIGQLVSGVAHELNNPLTGVIGFSQLLMAKDVSPEIREDLTIISGEAERAARIVRNLLTFARKHAPVKQMGQINNDIEDVLKLRAYEQKVNNVETACHFAPDLPAVMADHFQMQQVFLNIIINAEYFMVQAHKRGTLTITTEGIESIVRITIADDGPGIPVENLRKLFNPFFTTKEVGKGTGLGLSICHGIVAEHGGKIWATSEIDKGATFVVELPVGKSDER